MKSYWREKPIDLAHVEAKIIIYLNETLDSFYANHNSEMANTIVAKYYTEKQFAESILGKRIIERDFNGRMEAVIVNE